VITINVSFLIEGEEKPLIRQIIKDVSNLKRRVNVNLTNIWVTDTIYLPLILSMVKVVNGNYDFKGFADILKSQYGFEDVKHLYIIRYNGENFSDLKKYLN